MQLLRTSTIELFIGEISLRTLVSVSKAVDELKDEKFFESQKAELYLMFYYYLILHHYGDKALADYLKQPALKEMVEDLLEHVKETLKYMTTISELVYILTKENTSIEYLFYLCFVLSLFILAKLTFSRAAQIRVLQHAAETAGQLR